MCRWFPAVPVQPCSCFGVLWFFEERFQEHAVNVLLSRAVSWQWFRRRAAASGKRPILRRHFPVFVGADDATIQIEALGKQSSVAQPNSVAPAELAVNRGHLHLELTVVVPGPLDTR